METLSGGGAEKVLTDILNNLDYSKFNVDICLIQKKGIYLDSIPSNINIISLFPNRLIFRAFKYISNFFLLRWISIQYINIRIKNKYNVEISFMQGDILKIHSFIKNSKALKITWVHCDLSIERYWRNRFFTLTEAQKLYNKMDKIIFVSNKALCEFQKTIKNVNTQKFVFYNPVDKYSIIKKSQKILIPKEKFTFCAIGRLEPSKAYDRLLRVSHKLVLKGYDFDVWILGEGSLKKVLYDITLNLKLDKVVSFKGFISNPYPYLSKADVFISTSETEGFPLVIAEAICLGKAIVATNVTGTSEILDHGKYGLLVEESDEAIFNAMETLLTSNNIKKELEVKSLDRAKMFDIKKSIRDFESLISK